MANTFKAEALSFRLRAEEALQRLLRRAHLVRVLVSHARQEVSERLGHGETWGTALPHALDGLSMEHSPEDIYCPPHPVIIRCRCTKAW